MKKPIIGISASMLMDREGEFIGYQRSYVNDDYVQSVVRGGGIPLILPMHTSKEILLEQAELIDGLILSGGHDVSPLNWGEEPHRDIQDVFPERDDFDMLLIKYMIEKKKPILGICRGEQILNVFHGGTLYQDLSHKEDSYIKHNQKHSPKKPTHTVCIKEDSWLHDILGEEIRVNSFHHLAIKDLGKGLKVTATSKDGVIEAIEGTGEQLVIGLQWHPEMLSGTEVKMQEIFNKFMREIIEA